MKRQRVINIKHEPKSYESKEFDLDEYTSKLYEDGWIIKQIVTTSFTTFPTSTAKIERPVMIITMLIEEA